MVINRNEVLIHATTWMNLENVIPSERSQAQMTPFIYFPQEYWCGLTFPSPGDLPDPVVEPAYPVLAGGFFTVEPPGKLNWSYSNIK